MTILRSTFNQANTTDYRTFAGRAVTLLFVLLLTLGVLLAWDEIGRLGAYGYPAVFLVSLIGNAAFLLPAPGIALVVAVSGSLDPVAVGIVAGLGAALGELTGYLVGHSGQAVFEDKPIYWRIEGLMKKSGALVIFVLAAVPNPLFDIGGLVAGALRMPVWRFLLGAWLGKSLRFVLLAVLGSMAA
jgi:membrane protein YqaA with SNARE-associated domain